MPVEQRTHAGHVLTDNYQLFIGYRIMKLTIYFVMNVVNDTVVHRQSYKQ